MRTKGLTLKVFILLMLADAIQFAIMLSIKKLSAVFEAVTLHNLSLQSLVDIGSTLVHSPYFWLGIVCMASSFVIWMTVLSSIDLSVAFPLGSLSFIMIPILSVIFLHEEVPLLRWVGIAFIVSGIITLSISEKDTRSGS